MALHPDGRRAANGRARGQHRACTWRSPAGYRLRFALTLTGDEPGRLVVLAADGDLADTSTVRFAAVPGGTRLDIELRVATTRAWTNVAGPLLGPLFRYGHSAIMRRGERGLRRVLDSSVADPGLPGERGGPSGSAAGARLSSRAVDRSATDAEPPGEHSGGPSG
ncbi:hypothetical protein [Jiangella muralis]|uniref:hypothetical protein n=1 Tax=Jiangella muralis TaxID=702383 RepID=UPI00069E355C|nr:hypothetical protein [Jiangella muralis]